MKRLIFLGILLIVMQAASGQNLLDSLQGTWVVTKTTINNKNSFKEGTLHFSDDGKLTSTGNFFGSTNAMYTTNETTLTIHIESSKKSVTEWSARILNGVLHLTSVDNQKGKAPLVKIEAIRKE